VEVWVNRATVVVANPTVETWVSRATVVVDSGTVVVDVVVLHRSMRICKVG
jgi:hypothetical protein